MPITGRIEVFDFQSHRSVYIQLSLKSVSHCVLKHNIPAIVGNVDLF